MHEYVAGTQEGLLLRLFLVWFLGSVIFRPANCLTVIAFYPSETSLACRGSFSMKKNSTGHIFDFNKRKYSKKRVYKA